MMQRKEKISAVAGLVVAALVTIVCAASPPIGTTITSSGTSVPIATKTRAGVVKVGDNVNVAADGTISVSPPGTIAFATTTSAGLVKVGSGLSISGGVLTNTGVSGVATFKGRAGAVVPQAGDYSIQQITGASTVAATGVYGDLLNKPVIPAAQINSDWNATSGLAQILNKPTIPAAQVQSDWNATSGAAQILNKPTIPTTAAQVNADALGAATSVQTALEAALLLKAPIATPVHTGSVTAPVYYSSAPNGQHYIAFTNTTSSGYSGPTTGGTIYHDRTKIYYCAVDNDCKELGSGGATQLSALTDVSVPTPVTDDFLRYNGTAWVRDATVKPRLDNYSTQLSTHTAQIAALQVRFDNLSTTHNNDRALVNNLVIAMNAHGIDTTPPVLTRVTPSAASTASTSDSYTINYTAADSGGMDATHPLQYQIGAGSLTDFTSGSDTALSGFAANTPTTVHVVAKNAGGMTSTDDTTFTYQTAILGNPTSTSGNDYGTVAVGQSSTAHHYTLSNTGLAAAALSGTGIGVTGTDAAMFALSNNTCPTPPATLAGESSCVFDVTFTPSSSGSKTATVGDGVHTASLTGSGGSASPDFWWDLADNAANTTITVHSGYSTTYNGVMQSGGNTSNYYDADGMRMNENCYMILPVTAAALGADPYTGDWTVQWEVKTAGVSLGSADGWFKDSTGKQILGYLTGVSTIMNYINNVTADHGSITLKDDGGSTISLADGQWWTVRYVKTGSVIKVYVGPSSGALVLQTTTNTITVNWGGDLRLGGWGAVAIPNKGNYIKNLKMWKTAVLP